MAEPNLQEIHDFLIGIAHVAGSTIISANPSTVDTKKNCMAFSNHTSSLPEKLILTPSIASDLVTETDKAVEDLVSGSLKSAYPDYSCSSPLASSRKPPADR